MSPVECQLHVLLKSLSQGNIWISIFERMNSIVDKKLLQSHSIFPTLSIEQTAAYYSQYLGFQVVPYALFRY